MHNYACCIHHLVQFTARHHDEGLCKISSRSDQRFLRKSGTYGRTNEENYIIDQLYIPVETGKMWQTVINYQFLIDFIGMNKKILINDIRGGCKISKFIKKLRRFACSCLLTHKCSIYQEIWVRIQYKGSNLIS